MNLKIRVLYGNVYYTSKESMSLYVGDEDKVKILRIEPMGEDLTITTREVYKVEEIKNEVWLWEK